MIISATALCSFLFKIISIYKYHRYFFYFFNKCSYTMYKVKIKVRLYLFICLYFTR